MIHGHDGAWPSKYLVWMCPPNIWFECNGAWPSRAGYGFCPPTQICTWLHCCGNVGSLLHSCKNWVNSKLRPVGLCVTRPLGRVKQLSRWRLSSVLPFEVVTTPCGHPLDGSGNACGARSFLRIALHQIWKDTLWCLPISWVAGANWWVAATRSWEK